LAGEVGAVREVGGGQFAVWELDEAVCDYWRCARIDTVHPIEVIPMLPQLRYSKEEFVQRGTELYETQIRSQVETDRHGQIVAIR
jgi:hypothetical protein